MIKLISAALASLVLFGCSGEKSHCDDKNVHFGKAFEDKLALQGVINQIKCGNIRYECAFILPKYMPSALDSTINAQYLKNESIKVFGEEKEFNDGVTIKCSFYENDKLDPNKKNSNCKIYAGSLRYEFIRQNVVVYKYYIEVGDAKAVDLPQRILCIKEALSLAK